MSKLVAWRALQQEMAALEQRRQELQNDQEVQTDIEFEQKLSSLIADFGFSTREVLSILNPSLEGEGRVSKSRKPRESKTFKNPHTGDTIVTKGGNHKQLKAWRQQYGDEVSSWVV